MPLPTELFPPRQLVSDPAELVTYATDAGPDRALPDGVVFPQSTAEVARLAAWADARSVVLVPRGAGTGLAGGAVAMEGGLVLAMTRMDRILQIDAVGRTAELEAGTVNLELDRRVGAQGLYYPPDPASGRSSLIGGNLATNAGGPHCFKYGVTTNYVLGLEVVLADGRVATLGGPALDYPEYDLAGLVVGSEGTLALITRALLRLIRRPPAVRTLMVAFDSLEAAGDAVSGVIAAGLQPATLEAIDQPAMRIIEEHCQAGLPVESGAVLIVDLDGREASLDIQTREVAATLERYGATEVRVARSEEERQRIWHGRKSAAGAMARLAPNYYLTDITVRRSRLAPVLAEVNRICRRHSLTTASFFHAGDGNLHPLLPCDVRDEEMMRRVERALDEIVQLCLAEDGSITGEHGVGFEKRDQMARMHGGAEIQAMREVQRAFDPSGRLNPGKVLPEEAAEPRRCPPAAVAGTVLTPTGADEAAAGLRALAESGRKTAIGGNRLPDDAVRLSTAGLTGVRELAAHDLFLTAGAGTPMSEIEEAVAPHGLAAPILSPWPEATLGGLVAANLNSPLRMRYGGLRDLLLEARVALTDGRVLRAGRPLVKNVAGYDLQKVLVGSHGSLGLITEVTLKLVAAPRTRRTLALDVETLEQGLERARQAIPLAIAASGVVLCPRPDGDGFRLLYTAEGLEAEVEAELDEVTASWSRPAGEGATEAKAGTPAESAGETWCRFLADAASHRPLLRAGVPCRDLESLVTALPEEVHSRLLIDCAAGLVYGHGPVTGPGEVASWLDSIRSVALALGGYAVVLEGPSELLAGLDRWGYRPSALEIMHRLRAFWDPAGILVSDFLPLSDATDGVTASVQPTWTPDPDSGGPGGLRLL